MFCSKTVLRTCPCWSWSRWRRRKWRWPMSCWVRLSHGARGSSPVCFRAGVSRRNPCTRTHTRRPLCCPRGSCSSLCPPLCSRRAGSSGDGSVLWRGVQQDTPGAASCRGSGHVVSDNPGGTVGAESGCPPLNRGLSLPFSENLAKLFSLMDPNSPERVAFVSRALKWSSGGSGRLGHPRLHQLLALTLWRGRSGARGPGGQGGAPARPRLLLVCRRELRS